jgi:hypothetical protein
MEQFRWSVLNSTMNKNLLCLVLGLILSCPALVQAADKPARAPSPNAVTPDERKELAKARSDALKANPDLAAEGKDLDEKKKAWQKKVDAAAAVANPAVAPILAKMEAAHPAPSKPKDKMAKTPPAKPAATKSTPSTNAVSAPSAPN